MEIIRYPRLESTNTELARIAAEAPHATIIVTDDQTRGRGQRGNSWEAQAGANLTFSMLLRPENIRPAEQFFISEIVSLAIVRCVGRRLGDSASRLSIKWPNDIYFDDRKLAGILIEHSLCGNRISHTIVGIGLNVNQLEFLSDAPNPVSIIQIIGRPTDLESLLTAIGEEIEMLFDQFDNPQRFGELHGQYIASLWRRDGYYPYVRTADGYRFTARIADVASTGHITLTNTEGAPQTFAFKEVTSIL